MQIAQAGFPCAVVALAAWPHFMKGLAPVGTVFSFLKRQGIRLAITCDPLARSCDKGKRRRDSRLRLNHPSLSLLDFQRGLKCLKESHIFSTASTALLNSA